MTDKNDYYGFDLNGDGHVSLEEAVLTHNLFFSGRESEDDFDDDDDYGEDDAGESGDLSLMLSFAAVADATDRAYGAKPVYEKRIPRPETGAFHQFTDRHPVLFYFLMMAGATLLWLPPNAMLNAGAAGGAIAFCVIAYSIYFFLIFFAMNRSEKAYKREAVRLAAEADREERARGLHDPADDAFFARCYDTILQDYEGEQKLIPAGYLPYFQRNYTAFQYWAVAWIRDEQIKAKRYPWRVPRDSFDKRSFRPYKVFEERYLRKIRELNANGTYIGEVLPNE